MSNLSVCIHSKGQPSHSGWAEKGVDAADIGFRNTQQVYDEALKPLSARQIQQLKSQGNISHDWDKIYVTEQTDLHLIHQCKFYGLNRIGSLTQGFLSHKSCELPIGLYHSTFIHADIGHHNAIHHVHLLSHYITQAYVLLFGVNQIVTTPDAKFGIEPLREDEPQEGQLWLEIRNENTSRKVLPFLDLRAADAYLCSEYKHDKTLYERLCAITVAQNRLDSAKHYGIIGQKTVIKGCHFITDTNIGEGAYLKGVNKLKNVTIKSVLSQPVQIGEGCELVNGIIHAGCHIFYGVKAVRFVVEEHTSLKYGARLINAIIGANSNISCCEVLNTLTYAFHIQHHNNSFLCSAFVKGQSNVAAGATLGSNHNSRSVDGELTADRGFWPGLCTSFRFPSKFSSFNMVAKGDYPYEINNPFPFALLLNSLSQNELHIIPDFLLAENAYFLFRNKMKFQERDQRKDKAMVFEYDFVAPDTIQQIEKSLPILQVCLNIGENTVNSQSICEVEHSKRPVIIRHVRRSVESYQEILKLYLAQAIIHYLERHVWADFEAIVKTLFPLQKRYEWENIGGQLIPKANVQAMLHAVKDRKIRQWSEIHAFYQAEALQYDKEKLIHALWINAKHFHLAPADYNKVNIRTFLQRAEACFEVWHHRVKQSRQKDFSSTFADAYFESKEIKDSVLGKVEDDKTLQLSEAYEKTCRESVARILSKL